jgi:SAM-dependent methyltransferase
VPAVGGAAGARSQQDLQQRTIADFGDQWTRYTDNEGFYGSLELFADMLGPLLRPNDLAGKRVGDIGSGTGRIVEMLLAAGAVHVTAVEPSDDFEVLQRRFGARGEPVSLVHGPGEAIPAGAAFDAVTSIGVLHHVPDPAPNVRAAWQALRPGGLIVVWLYGREGNRAYLALLAPLRFLARGLPHGVLAALARVLDAPLAGYLVLCRWLPLPLRGYLNKVLGRMGAPKRRLIIYDQLKPAYAKYYTRQEAMQLLSNNGFADIRLHHRHGNCCTLVGSTS